MANTSPTLDLTASPALTTVLEKAANPAGDTIASLLGGATDADGNPLGVAITALDTSLGAWQYSTDSGASWLTIRADLVNSTTNELALLLGPTALIRLRPFGDLNGSLTEAISFRAWDQSEGGEGDYLVITGSGGSSAFSADSGVASLSVAAVNDAPTFAAPAGTGRALHSVGSSNDYAQSVTLQPDGKIVIAGLSWTGTRNEISLIRLNPDGTLDPNFNGTGKAVVQVGSSGSGAFSVVLQPDGKIVAAGASSSDFGLLRLHQDGSLDSSFNGSGKAVVALAGTDRAYSVAVQPDGKIVAAGVSSGDFGVIRLNADGTLDTSFNSSGKAVIPVGGGNDWGFSVTLQADGRIILAGLSHNGSNNDFSLVRLNADGTLDTSFAASGKAVVPVGGSTDEGYSVALQPDGRIIVAGYSLSGTDRDFSLIRLNADGTLDSSFGESGKAVIPVAGSEDTGNSVLIQPDGKVIVAGYTSSGGNDDFAVIRLNADGTLDTSFSGSGAVIVPVGASKDWGYSAPSSLTGRSWL